jgi:FdhD protein
LVHKQNNLTGVVVGFADLVRMTDGLDATAKRNLGEILVAARRAKVLAEVLGNSGCGVCGIDSLAQLHGRHLPARAECVAVSDEAVGRAFADLPAHQPLNARTHSVHAAAWCDLTGRVLLVREDVGRHNALDKLVGALAASHRVHEPGFVVMSSRCSYELVYKAAATNAQLLATISAPTTMALQWSAALGVPLASALRRSEQYEVVRFPASSHPFPSE